MPADIPDTRTEVNCRRKFLESCMGAAGTALVASAISVRVEARDTYQRPPEALGLLYDATLCIGCKACVAACKASQRQSARILD
jgi:ferredoxin